MTPQEFVAKWKRAALSERSACQQHFLDLCDVLGQPKQAAADPEGAFYTFERGVSKTGGGQGWADAWFRGHFGWEYKAKHKDLAAAYRQLLLYREDLENPPLLVVFDFQSQLRCCVATIPGNLSECRQADSESVYRRQIDLLRKCVPRGSDGPSQWLRGLLRDCW